MANERKKQAEKISRKLTGQTLKTAVLNNLAGVVMVNYSDTVKMTDAQSCLTAIGGDRSDPQGVLTAVPDKKGPVSNGDISLFSFLDDGGDCKFLMRPYIYQMDKALPNTVMDAQGDWNQELAAPQWSDVLNCHSLLTCNGHFYAGGYDLAKVIAGVITGSDAYQEGKGQVYDFARPASEAAPNSTDNTDPSSSSVFHVENLAVMNGMMYVQMDVNIVKTDQIGSKEADYNLYADAYVVQASIDASDGTLSFKNAVRTGKNALSLDVYDDRLYSCCAGGKQQSGAVNQASGIYITSVDEDLDMNVQEAVMPSNFQQDDIRDLSITPYIGTGTGQEARAYILCGHYDNNYTSFSGRIYRTPLSNLSAPHPYDWEIVQEFSGTGYFWAVHAADNGRFWFIKGDRIQVFHDSSQITAGTQPDQEFVQSDLTSHSDYKQINSVCFFPPDQTKEAAADMRLKGLRTKRFKYMNGQLRLAQEAFRLAQQAQGEERPDVGES